MPLKKKEGRKEGGGDESKKMRTGEDRQLYMNTEQQET